eukprot:TRINITY_DN15305_c0_g1_i1.p1 TRINITY_DN15305_c0_g1~~TRINITY_DN15305_c0_g1_i1.p1  ORF type:complete len:322 (-),score=52.48 TRINITY_DN15305_c0_g1_i1:19-984(-)
MKSLMALCLLMFMAVAVADGQASLATGGAYDYLLQLGSVIFVVLVAPFIYLMFIRQDTSYIPTSAWREEHENLIIKFDARYFLHTGWIGPVLGIGLAIAVSMSFHYEDVTKTHCDVPNPLPSISAAIGNNIPERWFVRFGIMLMAAQRVADCFIIYVYFKKRLPPVKIYHVMNILQSFCNFAENFSLWVVAFISSTEYFPFHEKGFILWTFFQLTKSFITLWLYPKAHPHTPAFQLRGFKYRVGCVALNLITMFCAGVVYYLHSFCYPYMYALYALCEYIIVLSNILFNVCVIFEYPSVREKNMIIVWTMSPHFTIKHDKV